MLNMRAQEYILSSDSKFVHADQHSSASKKWGKLWGKYLFWENSYS